MKHNSLLGFTILIVISLINLSRGTTPATTQAVDLQQQMESSWTDLEKPEPWSTRALLDFSDKPAATVEFFKSHLQPLKIEQKDLDDLLSALGNDDEKIWKPAFEKLEYFDPRLNVNLETLIQNAEDPLARTRLIEVLCDYPPDQLKGKTVNLRNTGGSGNYNFFEGHSSWWAEGKMSRLGAGWEFKKKWARANRALVLLQHIGTPAAMAVLKDMATGNPDAQPTKVAKAALESLGSADK